MSQLGNHSELIYMQLVDNFTDNIIQIKIDNTQKLIKISKLNAKNNH